MAETKRVGPLEVGQDLRFQQRQWAAQRWAWVALVGVVVAAVLGLFGNGPLSDTAAAAPDGSLRVEYGRFLRCNAPATLTVTFGPTAARDGAVRLLVDADYLRTLRLTRTTPRAEAEQAGPDAVALVFRASPGGPGAVTLEVEPDAPGPASGRFRVDGGPAVEVGHFVYP